MDRLIPAGTTEQYVAVDGGEVRVLVGGAASDLPPLVLVHGGGSDNSAISWFHSYDAFGGDRRVVGIDLPGFGGSMHVAPVGGPAAMADLIVGVARSIGIVRAVFVGVSMGGDVVLNIGLRHADAVEGLVLVAPGGLRGEGFGPAAQIAAYAAVQLPLPLLSAFAWVANRFTGMSIRAMVHDPDALPKTLLDEFVREAHAPGAGLGYATYNREAIGRFGMRNNLLPVVQRISAPALFFHGANDPLVDPGGSQRAARRMPNARLVMVPETGHWAQLESPERFSAEVTAFLTEVDGLVAVAQPRPSSTTPDS
ncbi:MAG: alpha/beta fold hydrolase [Pseudoclavibacter sp.]